jgi:HEAT repeat protein
MGGRGRHAAILKDRARLDEDSDVRIFAVRQLARGWKDDPETLPILKDLVPSDQDSDVRSAAVQELAQGWKHDPETA